MPASTPDPSARYTPKAPAFRLRPGWHRWAGWAGVVLGLAVIVVNDIELFTNDTTVMPGGHSELYLFLGVLVIAGAAWMLGAFDRGTTIYD